MSEVVRLAARGEGVTADGRFVPLAAPGDHVADNGEIVPGPYAQVPPCRHFPVCGGCQLQHIDDAAYAGFVVDRVASALRAQGIEGVDIRTPHLSPPRSRRRATLHFASRGKTVAIGFKGARSHDIVDMRECHILLPALFALVDPLRRLLRGRGKAGQVSMTLVDGGVDLALAGATFDGLAGADALTEFASGHRLARLSIDDGYGPQARWEPEPVAISLGWMEQECSPAKAGVQPFAAAEAGAQPSPGNYGTAVNGLAAVRVLFPSGGFLQATADGEAALVAAVREAVSDVGNSADLFAGLGTFALALSGRVLAVEGARDIALALKSAAVHARRMISVEHRDLFRRPLTLAELAAFEAVVLDPPRAGAKEQVAELARSQVQRIAYASCNPNTFARDAKTLLENRYKLAWVQPVGQFRWSTHVELAASFVQG